MKSLTFPLLCSYLYQCVNELAIKYLHFTLVIHSSTFLYMENFTLADFGKACANIQRNSYKLQYFRFPFYLRVISQAESFVIEHLFFQVWGAVLMSQPNYVLTILWSLQILIQERWILCSHTGTGQCWQNSEYLL